jgi:amidohydrolase
MLKTIAEISRTTESIRDHLIEIRRDFHQYPETSGNEARTSKIIEEFLSSLGLEVMTEVGGHGVVGILRGGMPGKIIAWRADIDAFTSDFPDVVDFQSKISGVRHICGHDVHTSIGLGIAEVLSSYKNEINGTIIFIFQPAEESYTGAAKMIEEGILDKLNPEAVFALHVAPLPAGVISVKAEEMFSVKKKIKILLNNQSNMNAIERECKHLMECIPTVADLDYFSNYDTFADVNLGFFSPNSIYKDILFI